MTATQILLYIGVGIVVLGLASSIVVLKARFHAWMNTKGLRGVLLLIGGVLLAILATQSTKRDPSFLWFMAFITGVTGLGSILIEHSEFVRARVRATHVYGVLMVVGLAIGLRGWLIPGPGRWISVAVGLVIAGVPAAIWIRLWRARRQDAREWPPGENR